MALAMEHRIHDIAWSEPRPGGHVAHAALLALFTQAEAGAMCPMSMTYSAVPALRRTPEIGGPWLDKLIGGGDWDTVFAEYSDAKGATQGALYDVTQGSLDQQFAGAAFSLQVDELSHPVETKRGFHIIWRKKWTWSYGADLIATDERGIFDDPTNKETRTFLIAALPVSLRYDGSNDLLDPTTGFRLGGRLSPEISAHGGKFTYGRIQIDASAYRPVSDSVVVAGRVRVGTILGAKASDIAPSRRFYSGGGGSVRGYGYQQLGPRDAFGDPIGGRGLAEFSLEARVRLKAFGGNFGVVPFIDGGTLTSNVTPDVGNWQFGAGIGVRYHSSFGPIRLDVGTPLNPRSGDARVAVVVSLGQAF
jgi:translocation and assembly module TamA